MRCLFWGLILLGLCRAVVLNQKLRTVGRVSQPAHVFIFGLGYTGLAIASYIKREYLDCIVSGCCTKEEKVEALRKLGINAVVFNTDSCHDIQQSMDLSHDSVAKVLLGLEDSCNNNKEEIQGGYRRPVTPVTHVLSTIPPVVDFARDPVLEFHEDTLKELSAPSASVNSNGLRYLGYLSTTGVYGDHSGAWVTEETPLRALNTSM